MEQSDRSGVPLSMMMLDLDHFKLVNDTWGHPVGDEQLKLTARTMENVKRETDVLVRFGGEEFVLLLLQTDKEGAVTAARKIRKGIEENCHPVTGIQTASIGVAERMRSESFRHWYRRVDVALYRAKENGRNRVVVSDENDRLPTSSVNIDWNIQWESGNEEADIHKGLVKKALEIKKAYLAGEIKASAFFSFVVDDVIFGHMVNTDRKFFSYTRREANRYVVRGPLRDM